MRPFFVCFSRMLGGFDFFFFKFFFWVYVRIFPDIANFVADGFSTETKFCVAIKKKKKKKISKIKKLYMLVPRPMFMYSSYFFFLFLKKYLGYIVEWSMNIFSIVTLNAVTLQFFCWWDRMMYTLNVCILDVKQTNVPFDLKWLEENDCRLENDV